MVKASLRISHVTHPMSNVCNGILFLLDGDVIREICGFGLYDTCQEVSTIWFLEQIAYDYVKLMARTWSRHVKVL